MTPADPRPGGITSRPMRDDADFWRMRALLVETVPIAPMGLNWDVRRLDGKRFYNADPEANRLMSRQIQLWGAAEGQLVGYVLPEGSGDAHLQVHPDYRHIEGEMIAWAQGHLAVPTGDGSRHELSILVYEYD